MDLPLEQLSSSWWLDHFRVNLEATPAIGWESAGMLTAEERAAVAGSLRQFQIGEGAQGRGLMRRASRHPMRQGDEALPDALGAFIREEQRHSEMLGRFLDREGIARAERHWVDDSFRFLRKLAGFELCMRVLAAAEIIAIPYYTALREATGSAVLQGICDRVLRDEEAHLRFQASVLGRAAGGSPLPAILARLTFDQFFLEVTILVVWKEHRRVLKRGGYTWVRFRRECFQQQSLLQSRWLAIRSWLAASGESNCRRMQPSVGLPPA